MRWFSRLSTVPTMAVIAVVAAAGWYGVTAVVMPELRPAGRLIGAVTFGVFFGVVFGYWLVGQRRSAGPAVLDPSFRAALRSGTVPPDVDTTTWRRAVEHHRSVMLRQRWFGPVVFGLGTLLYVAFAVMQDPVWWLGAALFSGFLIASLVQTPRRLRTTAAMLDELDRRGDPH